MIVYSGETIKHEKMEIEENQTIRQEKNFPHLKINMCYKPRSIMNSILHLISK